MKINYLFSTLLVTSMFQIGSAFAQESAAVLPLRIVRGRLVTVYAPGVVEQYNNSGTKESLVAAYDGKVIDATKAAPALVGGLHAFGKDALIPLLNSTYAASASINVQQYITAFEYGITPQLSLGVIVPVVKYQANASITATNGYDAVKTGVAGNSMLEPGVNEYIRQTTLGGLGYQQPGNFAVTALGDVEVGGKYQFYKANQGVMAFQTGLRLPTATHKADQSNLFDRDIGDGQLDLAAQWMGEYHLNPNLFIGASTKLTWQMADSVDRYVRATEGDLLPDLSKAEYRDQNIQRDLGDVFNGELSANYEFGDHQYKTWGIYEYEAQAQDSYSGTKGLAYHSLETGTNSISHRVVAGFGFTTIPMFARKKFSVPMDIKLSYSFPVAGKNITNAKYSRLDVMVYF